MTPIDIPGINNITISGRIGSGATTLASKLSRYLGWALLEGGDLFEKIHKELNLDQSMVGKRPDHFDLEYEERIKKMLKNERRNIIQSHLAGYDAQKIDSVFKILIICEDERGNDRKEIRIDRLINRDGKSIEEAKKEVNTREEQHLKKFRRLYADNNPEWIYWDKKYYDLVVNSFSHNKSEVFTEVLRYLDIKP